MSIEIRALELFAAGYDLTRGELRSALHLPDDTEVTSRIRDLRKRGFEIAVERKRVLGDGGKLRTEYRYKLPEGQREKALLFLTERKRK